MGFLRRAKGDKSARSDTDPIATAREQLRRHGEDPDQPHTTHHLLYLPSVNAAQQAARALRRPNREIAIEPSGRKGFWLVIVTQTVVITPESIAQINDEIAMAMDLFGGEYDMWHVKPKGS
jgi:hypothetical protein